jgi:hypothetical protein
MEGDGFLMKTLEFNVFYSWPKARELSGFRKIYRKLPRSSSAKDIFFEFSLSSVFFAFIAPKALCETLNTTCVPSENLVLRTSTDSVRIRARLWRVLNLDPDI